MNKFYQIDLNYFEILRYMLCSNVLRKKCYIGRLFHIKTNFKIYKYIYIVGFLIWFLNHAHFVFFLIFFLD